MIVLSEEATWLQERVTVFVGTLEDCFRETTFAQDRTIFSRDIAVAANWIVELQRGEEPERVVERILSTDTDKHFTDYWRNGEWGERSAIALEELRSAIRLRF
jgi:hypothetical protein